MLSEFDRKAVERDHAEWSDLSLRFEMLQTGEKVEAEVCSL